MCRPGKGSAGFTAAHSLSSTVVNELSKALRARERERESRPPPISRKDPSSAVDEGAIDCHERTIIILDTLCASIPDPRCTAINFTGIDVCPPSQLAPIYNPSAPALPRSFPDPFYFNLGDASTLASCSPRAAREPRENVFSKIF